MNADCKYLEASTTNGTAPSTWKPNIQAPYGCEDTNVMNATQRTAIAEIGRGRANTILITGASCNVSSSVASVASIAKAYNGGGKTDWFLPSQKELNELCKYARTQTTGNTTAICGISGPLRSSFASGLYWSSSENTAGNAWYQSFDYGDQGLNYKGGIYYVRPVRAF